MMRIGMMSFAHGHADSYASALSSFPNVDLVGVADDDADRRADAAAKHGMAEFDSYDSLLATDLDGVVICSENARHREMVELAAKSGAAVLCEKPLATSVADARAMIDACETAGVQLMTAFPMRFNAPLQRAHQAVARGQLGRVLGVEGLNRGRVPETRPWFIDPALSGGGCLTDHIVHVADLLRWFTGAEVTEVYAQSNKLLHGDKILVETAGIAALTFANGIVATIDSSWSRPTSYPTWGDVKMQVIGERGILDVDALAQNLHSYDDNVGTGRRIPWGANADTALVREFIAAVEEKRPAIPDGWDGLRAVEIVEAAYESVASGQPARIAAV